VHGVSFKKRAPRAIKEIRAFAEQAMVSEQNLLLVNHIWQLQSFDPARTS
jgi:ribosomal protein L31E